MRALCEIYLSIVVVVVELYVRNWQCKLRIEAIESENKARTRISGNSRPAGNNDLSWGGYGAVPIDISL